MEPNVSARRVLILLVTVLVGVPVGLALVGLLLLLLWTHGSNLADRLSLEAPAAPSAEVLPQPPLPGDEAFPTLLAIAEPLHKAAGEQGILKSGCYAAHPIPPPCVDWLASQAGTLKALDEWLAGPSPYKLARPADLGPRGRLLVERFTADAPVPNFIAFQTLARLLAVRAMTAMDAGDGATALKALRTLFALADFLTQNPILISQMVGYAVERIGLGAILRAAGPRAPLEDLDAALPDPTGGVAALRRSYQVEQVVASNSFDDAAVTGLAEGYQVWLAKGLGVYSGEVTWRRFRAEHRALVAHLEGKALGTAFYVPADPRACAPEPEDLAAKLRTLPNRLGRNAFCGADWARFTALYGATVDAVAATRVALAARRYHRDRGSWPGQETDLVPAYLKAWPVSVLDGQPMRWTADRSGIELLDVDGKSPCTGNPAVPCPARFAPS